MVVPVSFDLPIGFTASLRHTLPVKLLPDLSVTLNRRARPFGERIDHRDTDAVESAGYLVSVAAEFATGVEHSEHGLERRFLRLRMDLDRDTATVVDDFDDVVRQESHGDFRAVPGHRLVDRVVHDLPDKVVQPFGRRAADVHARTLPHRVEPFEHLDRFRTVLRAIGSFLSHRQIKM
jgi:hypothetical protein